MNNFTFLQNYQELQLNITFDETIDLQFARIGLSQIDSTSYWNMALTNQILNDNELYEIERIMKAKNRQPAIYFENKQQLIPLINFLKRKNYQFKYEDSWMFFDNQKIIEPLPNQIKKVTNKNELEIFLKTFNQCYQNNDPQNPYGKLGNYLKLAKKAWKQHHSSNRVEYFIVLKNNSPIAVASLTNYKQIGYISNVGSLRSVRGQGFGKAATLYCVAQSKKNKNKIHCLATEEKTYPNYFYKKIGFSTKFPAVCYSKNLF